MGRRVFLSMRFTALIALLACACATEAFAQAEYSVRIEGVEDEAIRGALRNASNAAAEVENPPRSRRLLERRLERDAENLMSAFESLGYYGADVEARVDGAAPPYNAVFVCEPGPPYTIERIDIRAADASGESLSLGAPDITGLETGMTAAAAPILAADGKILTWLQYHGYPFPEMGKRRVLVDHEANALYLEFTVHPGPKAVFGPLQIEGLESVKPIVVERETPWQDGDPYDKLQLERLRTRLYNRNLFSVVRVAPGEALTEDGRVPVAVRLDEAKHRTIAGGLRFDTIDGAGARVMWEHRNMRGLGERLRIQADVATIESAVRFSYDVPRFHGQDKHLNATFAAGLEDTDAFESTFADLEGSVRQGLGKGRDISYGLRLRFSDVEQDGEDETFLLLSSPVRYTLDRRNDTFRPSSGYRANIGVEPFVDLLGIDRGFVRFDAGASVYQKLDEEAAWIVAARLKVGTIVGENLGGIPPDTRFYAGGGGSIRGYGFQRVGPLDEDDDPIGGASLLEGAIELRRSITESIGIVAFVDGGTVYEDSLPEFDETIRWGAGLGFRYFTPLGPIRFDAGFPLNKRDGDEAFQLYISIGHAF